MQSNKYCAICMDKIDSIGYICKQCTIIFCKQCYQDGVQQCPKCKKKNLILIERIVQKKGVVSIPVINQSGSGMGSVRVKEFTMDLSMTLQDLLNEFEKYYGKEVKNYNLLIGTMPINWMKSNLKKKLHEYNHIAKERTLYITSTYNGGGTEDLKKS